MAARMICVGHDALLLETRKRILERDFHVCVAKGLAELAAQAATFHFDLILLCQTLSDEECEAAVRLVHQRSPRAKVLPILRSSQRSRRAGEARRFDPVDGPRALLERVAAMLQRPSL